MKHNFFWPWLLGEDGKVHLPNIKLPNIVWELYAALSIFKKEVKDMWEMSSPRKDKNLWYWLDPKVPLKPQITSLKSPTSEDLMSKNSLDYSIEDEDDSSRWIWEQTIDVLNFPRLALFNLLQAAVIYSFEEFPKRYRETKCMRYIIKLNKKGLITDEEDRFWMLVYILESVKNFNISLSDINLSKIDYQNFEKDFSRLYVELLKQQALCDEDVQELKEIRLI